MTDFFTIMNQYKYSTKPLDPKRVEVSAVEKSYVTVPVGQTAKQDDSEITKGFVVEKTTPVSEQRTVNEVMKISYPRLDWDNMSFQDKGKQIVKHLTSIDKEEFKYLATKTQPDGRIGWLKSLLLNERTSKEEAKVIVGALKQLNVSDEELAELQAQGVDMAFDEDNINAEDCQLQVTEDMHAYGDKAQKVAIDKSSISKFDSVKISGAAHSSEVIENLQEYAVNKYVDGCKDSSDEVKKQVGTAIVNQYGQYAKSSELGIHTKISSAYTDFNISEIVEYAASNIYNFDKENQVAAVQITVNTKNEAAINAAASQWQYYDKTAQEDIKSVIYSSGYDSANQTLAQAELNSVIEKTNIEAEIVEVKEKSATSENIEQVKESIKKQDIDSLNQQVKNLSNSEKMVLLKQCPSVELVKAILNTNPSLEVLAKIDEAYLKDFGYKRLGNQIGFLSASAQLYIVKDSAANHELGSLNRYLLKASVKCEYDKLMNENKERNVA